MSNNDLKESNIETTEHHFALLETLGEGAMGEVVLARDENLQRKVAIKRINNEMSQNKFLLDNFITEAQITAQLEHPCIIPVYGLEVNQSGDIAYSMKRIEGQTLKELIQSAKQQYDASGQADDHHDLNAFLEHFLKVADAVEYAHQKGIIHRDLKPENIMIGPYNEVYILDWGIARPMSEPPQNMNKNAQVLVAKTAEDFNVFEGRDVLGTPCYMSPEQAAGGNEFLNEQSDLYSLGLILFELISLKKAYTADEDFNQTIDNSIIGKTNDLVPYHTQRGLPRELVSIIKKSTRRIRKERYREVKELSDEIRRFLRGEAILAEPDTSIQKVQRWISQNKEKTLVLILSITLLSASVIAWSFYQRHTDNMMAQQREATQAEFLNVMRNKSQEINDQFLAIAGLTQEFAAGIEQVLGSQSTQANPYYTFQMAQNGQMPPDTRDSKLYSSKVNLNHFVFKNAPGVNENKTAPLMQKVATYAPFMKRLFLMSHGDPSLKADSKKGQDLLLNQGVLAADTYAGFEDGFGFTYPMSITNTDYDSRQRPWYTIAKDTKEVQWGQPYFDSSGLGWVIPSTKAIYDASDAFKGVVGMDIKVPQISQKIKIQEKYIKDVYLLNATGDILIQGSAKVKSYEKGQLVNELEELKPFPQARIVKAIQGKSLAGYIQTTGSNKSIYSYQFLSATGWYYVVEADSQTLFVQH